MISASGVAGRSLLNFSSVPLREALSVSRFGRSVCLNDSPQRIQLRNSTRQRVLSASMPDNAQSTASGSGSKAINVVVKGTVQGVFYRKWTVSTAQKLGLNGWVRNCRDGSVEAVFSGPSSAVDTMVQQCSSGPSAARVGSVDVSQWDNEVPPGFQFHMVTVGMYHCSISEYFCSYWPCPEALTHTILEQKLGINYQLEMVTKHIW